jgi:small-conductance mechanosensitive channel
MSNNRVSDARRDSGALQVWVRAALLFAFALLAATAWWLDQRGATLGKISETGTIAFFLCLAFSAAAAYEMVSLVIVAVMRMKAGSVGEVKMLTGLVRFLIVLAAILALAYGAGLRSIGGTVGASLIGMLLGWSLQAPVSGMAAWALISLKRPFRVGDRVLFPSLALLGDVLEVGLMYTKLDQVGGSIGSEEAIGRNILIPNAMLFSQVAINYTPKQLAAYFLDEVVIRLTYDSDWDAAEKILLSAAKEVTADIIRETGKAPYIRSDIYDYGVYMRLRYQTLATDRPRIGHEILKRIFLEFQANPRVDFAIPFIYSYRKGVEMPSRGSVPSGPEPIAEIPIDNIDDPQAEEPLSEEDLKGIEELAWRIQKMGLLQPIVVRMSASGRWELVAGRFRLLACKHLGWKAIPGIVRTGQGAMPDPDIPPPHSDPHA